jgi:hypothetical protein
MLSCDPAAAKLFADKLKRFGYRIEWEKVNPGILRDIRDKPPVAVVIDLTRAPTQGRDVGVYIRHHKTTRKTPIVFINGGEERVARAKELLPDAVYTEWKGIRKALKWAIAHPPAEPHVPKSLLAGYSGSPLVKKLGIEPKSRVVLIDAPLNFERILVDLPEGVILRRRLSKGSDMMIWFVKSRKTLTKRIKRIAPMVGKGGLWITWPKQVSRIHSDLSQKKVREVGLSNGLVDYKVCAIDGNWSGLKFARRR